MVILGIEVNWFVVSLVVAFPIILGILVHAGYPECGMPARDKAYEALPDKAGDFDFGEGNQRSSIIGVAAAIIIIYVTYQWLA